MRPAPLVTMTFWGVPPRHVPHALARMATERRPLGRTPGLRFWRLLGTGDGRTFTLRDADPLHWGLLAVWEDDADLSGGPWRRWDAVADERLDVRLRPLSSRGLWSGTEPFGAPAAPARPPDGPVASLTRARIRPSRTLRFHRAVPPVSTDLNQVEGLRLAVGIGEAPVGLQGTFSLWDGAAPLVEFAHRRAAHAAVVARTPGEDWYSEELFARFAVEGVTGTFAGRAPMEDPR